MFDFRATAKEREADKNRLWLVVKDMKVGKMENRFELRGGENIRIGRVVFTVREIVNSKVRYRTITTKEALREDFKENNHSNSIEEENIEFLKGRVKVDPSVPQFGKLMTRNNS